MARWAVKPPFGLCGSHSLLGEDSAPSLASLLQAAVRPYAASLRNDSHLSNLLSRKYWDKQHNFINNQYRQTDDKPLGKSDA